MKRHIIIFYTVLIVLVIAGRYAWQHCEWEWISRVSSLAAVGGILIQSWEVFLPGKDNPTIYSAQRSLTSARLAIIVLCLATLLAGFGALAGKTIFGCAG
jgi:hypothetical protein